MEVSGQLHAPAVYPPGKEPPEPIGQEAGWAPKQVWTLWRKKLALTGIEPGPSSPHPVVIPTKLSRPPSILEVFGQI
jgi:hypothetical protein